jgi:hypothetical protein
MYTDERISIHNCENYTGQYPDYNVHDWDSESLQRMWRKKFTTDIQQNFYYICTMNENWKQIITLKTFMVQQQLSWFLISVSVAEVKWPQEWRGLGSKQFTLSLMCFKVITLMAHKYIHFLYIKTLCQSGINMLLIILTSCAISSPSWLSECVANFSKSWNGPESNIIAYLNLLISMHTVQVDYFQYDIWKGCPQNW